MRGVLTAVFVVTVLEGFANSRKMPGKEGNQVAADGLPTIQFLNEEGQVVSQLPAAK